MILKSNEQHINSIKQCMDGLITYTNLGRNIQAKYPETYNWILGQTQFLANPVNYNERIYCVLNDITNLETILCPISNKPRLFEYINTGYKHFAKGVKSDEINKYTFGLQNIPPITQEDIEYLENNFDPTKIGITQSNYGLYCKIIHSTKFLKDDATVSERVYCLLNDITIQKPYNLKNYYEGYCETNLEELEKEYEQYAKMVGSGDLTHGMKVRRFISRNSRVNSHLYEYPITELNKKFIMCPVLNVRVVMLKRNYIENLLLIEYDDFINRYPTQLLESPSRLENVKKGLTEIDPETGLTKHQLSVEKSKERLSAVDPETGFTGYQKLGMATKQTHMANIDEYGRNGYNRIAKDAIVKGNKTKIEKGIITSTEDRDSFQRYKRIVIMFTERHRSEITKGFKTGLAGVENAWHIDHSYSIKHGFDNKISPLVIGHRANLRMIPWEDNLAKHSSSDITETELFSKTGYNRERSQEEYEVIMQLINKDIEDNQPIWAASIMESFYATEVYKKYRI